MKSIPKLIRHFVGILTLGMVLVVLLNVAVLGVFVAKQSRYKSPWDTANEVAQDLQENDQGYFLSGERTDRLIEQHIWAILIADDTQQIVWQTSNLPANIPTQYTLSDIADLTRGYINGYPTFTGEMPRGLLVVGYPRESFWKHPRATWDYNLIANAPVIAISVLAGNMLLIFVIYIIVNLKLLRSVKPITNGIQELSAGVPVQIKQTGLLSELAESMNKTSAILQDQRKQLQKKDTARANWIAGVSHDMRTPLSMVMGYAGQLENASSLSDIERKKVAIILQQSEKMKNLISDLNLASKLEYNMQPVTLTNENVVAIVRQVIVDFINMDIYDKFPLEWNTENDLSCCMIQSDKELLKRAVSNLITNSMVHNEEGCTIYVSVATSDIDCSICIEDNGTGASPEQVNLLNTAQHYMVCDTNTTEQSHGLGLLIVKQIILAHNGKMLINHSCYGGFRVVLTLPKSKIP